MKILLLNNKKHSIIINTEKKSEILDFQDTFTELLSISSTLMINWHFELELFFLILLKKLKKDVTNKVLIRYIHNGN